MRKLINFIHYLQWKLTILKWAVIDFIMGR